MQTVISLLIIFFHSPTPHPCWCWQLPARRLPPPIPRILKSRTNPPTLSCKRPPPWCQQWQRLLKSKLTIRTRVVVTGGGLACKAWPCVLPPSWAEHSCCRHRRESSQIVPCLRSSAATYCTSYYEASIYCGLATSNYEALFIEAEACEIMFAFCTFWPLIFLLASDTGCVNFSVMCILWTSLTCWLKVIMWMFSGR